MRASRMFNQRIMNINLRQAVTAALFVVLSFWLLTSAIGCAGDETTSSAAENTTQETTRETTKATTTVATTTAQPTPTEPPPQITSRLTGLPMDAEDVDRRPIAVMINNIRKATPQIGIAAADIIFEMEVEGGITRMLAVFQNTDAIPELGSIRSARHNYVDLAGGLDAILVHVGGSYAANDQMARQKTEHIDLGLYSAAYWRDEEWRTQRGMEHSVKTTGERLQAVLDEKTSWRTDVRDSVGPLFNFREPEAFEPADGSGATRVTVPYSRYITAVFNYDADRKVYTKNQFGSAQIDLATNEAIAFTNVFVLQTTIVSYDGGVLRQIDLSKGDGFYVSGGQMQPIRWQKGDTDDPLAVTTADGQPLPVNAGKSFISIVSKNQTIRFDP